MFQSMAMHGHKHGKSVVKNLGLKVLDNQRELESAEKTDMYCFYLQSWILESKKLAGEK